MTINWILAILIAATAAVIFGAARAGLRADAAYREDAVFYPVSVRKFLVMTVMTVGIYDVFWLWKFYNWARERDGAADIMPFWRGFFYPLWVYPAFDRANQRLPVADQLPKGVGIVAAVIGVTTFLGTTIIEFFTGEHALIDLYGLMMVFVLLPVVVIVNRLNRDRPDIIATNSRYTVWTVAGLLCTVAWVAYIVVVAQG